MNADSTESYYSNKGIDNFNVSFVYAAFL